MALFQLITLDIRGYGDSEDYIGSFKFEDVVEDLSKVLLDLKNEIVILKSYSLSEKIVKELELGISYFQHGLIISNELFQNSPFKVNIDSSHLQLTGVDFYITFIDNNTFEIEINSNDQYPYNINTEKLEKNKNMSEEFLDIHGLSFKWP